MAVQKPLVMLVGRVHQLPVGDTTPVAPHQATHVAGGSDAIPWTTVNGSGLLSVRPVAGPTNAGYLYYATDNGNIYRSDGTLWNSISGASGVASGEQPGDVIWSGATARANCYPCDGSAKSRSVDAQLFSAIGTTFGPGDGSTTFNLPDYRGRGPMGSGTGAGGGASGDSTVPVGGAALTPRVNGQWFGEQSHVQTWGELVPHAHASASPYASGGGGGSTTAPPSQGLFVDTTFSGGGLPFNVTDPKLVMNAFIVYRGTAVSNGTPVLAGKTVFVDSVFGVDATGQRQRSDLPFLTLFAAGQAAFPGDTILVRPGIYTVTGTQSLYFNGVTWNFTPGAIVDNNKTAGPTEPLFNVIAGESLIVLGQGQFTGKAFLDSLGGTCVISLLSIACTSVGVAAINVRGAANVRLMGDNLTATSATFPTTLASASFTGTCRLSVNRIESTGGTAVQIASGSTGILDVIVNKIVGSSAANVPAMLISGGSCAVVCDVIQSSGGNAITVSSSAGNSLDVTANVIIGQVRGIEATSGVIRLSVNKVISVTQTTILVSGNGVVEGIANKVECLAAFDNVNLHAAIKILNTGSIDISGTYLLSAGYCVVDSSISTVKNTIKFNQIESTGAGSSTRSAILNNSAVGNTGELIIDADYIYADGTFLRHVGSGKIKVVNASVRANPTFAPTSPIYANGLAGCEIELDSVSVSAITAIVIEILTVTSKVKASNCTFVNATVGSNSVVLRIWVATPVDFAVFNSCRFESNGVMSGLNSPVMGVTGAFVTMQFATVVAKVGTAFSFSNASGSGTFTVKSIRSATNIALGANITQLILIFTVDVNVS